MKTSKRILAAVLALILAFSACTVAYAESSMTVDFLTAVAGTGKLRATVTSFTYQQTENDITFDFYDDFNTSSICCDFTDKGIKLIYGDSQLKCVFPRFFSYLTVSKGDIALADTAFAAVEAFQKLFKGFIDDPKLQAFNMSTSTVTRNGQTLTCETFTGKVIGTSGSFYFNSSKELAEVILTDNAGEAIGFTLENAASTFDNSAFTVPFYYLNLSLLWKIIYYVLIASGTAAII